MLKHINMINGVVRFILGVAFCCPGLILADAYTYDDRGVGLVLLPAQACGKPMFRDPSWGLEVIEIVADGVRVDPQTVSVVSESRLDSLIPGPVDFYIYICTIDRVRFVTRCIVGNDEYSEYRIPELFESLSVKYRVRYADGSFGAEGVVKLKRTKPGPS